MNDVGFDTTQYYGLILEIGEEDKWGDRKVLVSAPAYPPGPVYWGYGTPGPGNFMNGDIRSIDEWAVTLID